MQENLYKPCKSIVTKGVLHTHNQMVDQMVNYQFAADALPAALIVGHS